MLLLESYDEHERHLPSAGKFIIGQFDKESIVVYEGFKADVAEYAVQNQRFGSDDYDFERITWFKPSFLWMMYYSGWAKKENLENVLAIRVRRSGFDAALRRSVMSTYHKNLYGDLATWQAKHNKSEIELQWESYHDLNGNKTDRKAVKIGITGKLLQEYNHDLILSIENITPYIREQQELIKANRYDRIMLPRERVYAPDDLKLLTRIDATAISL